MCYKLLICDINIKAQGHYIGYNQYLLDNFYSIEARDPSLSISFLFNSEAKLLLNFKGIQEEKVAFLDGINHKENTIKSRHIHFNKVIDFAHRNKINHLIFLDLDQYQLPIFFSKIHLKLSGIIFRPHHRIEASNNHFLSLIRSRTKLFKKKLAEKLLVSKKANIQNVFILNDKSGVKFLNNTHGTTAFKYLPDPIFSYPANTSINNFKGLSSEAYKYLIFGSLNERKNITNILAAYNQATLNIKSELVIAGPAQKGYEEYLNNYIFGLRNIDSVHKKITIKNGFVTNEEMDYIFSVTDVCLLIYRDFFGSSGILGRAALHKKKVIGPNVGLIAEMISQYSLGVVCDPNSVNNIAEMLELVHSYRTSKQVFDKFYEDHSPKQFISTLLEKY